MKNCPKCEKELGDFETMCRCGHKFPQETIVIGCLKCGTGENLTRLNAKQLVCGDCRWEHYSGETKHLLKKGLEKAYAQLPKGKDESHYDYFNRYREFIKKQVFTRLPYNPALRYESEVTGTSPEELERLEREVDARARL